jgi:hypothetical protein
MATSRSPQRAGFSASRRFVLTRSLGLVGASVSAITSQATASSVSLPIQAIASWARFVTGPHPFYRPELPDQFANVFRLIGNRTERSDITVIRLVDRNRNAVRVEIQANKWYLEYREPGMERIRDWVFEKQ